MPDPTTYRLAELNGFIRRVFALNLPEAVWVTAELAQANVSRGHCWLTLVEKGEDSGELVAQLDGVVWAGQLKQLQRNYGLKLVRELLVGGMSVRLKVTTSFHARFGLRAVVEDIDPSFTLGELERRRREVLDRLAAEDLLNRNGRIPFPLVPRRLAVISSDTAAGLADFRKQLDANPYGYRFEVKVFSAAMQGAKTSPEILARLRQLRAWDGAFDAVVIIRGGGGRTDLAAFDEELLCRAVAEFHLPVIVGIGHETDDSVLDRVAARSLKTPTATAVFLIEQLMMGESRVLHLGRSISQITRRQTAEESPRLERQQTIIRHLATQSIARAGRNLDNLQQAVARAEQQTIREAKLKLDNLERLLAALRPEATLARGYALVSQEGKLITGPDQLTEGEVEVLLRDGRTTLKK